MKEYAERGSGRDDTGIRCHVTSGISVEVPLMLGRLLKIDGLEVGSQGLLILDWSGGDRADVTRRWLGGGRCPGEVGQ